MSSYQTFNSYLFNFGFLTGSLTLWADVPQASLKLAVLLPSLLSAGTVDESLRGSFWGQQEEGD